MGKNQGLSVAERAKIVTLKKRGVLRKTNFGAKIVTLKKERYLGRRISKKLKLSKTEIYQKTHKHHLKLMEHKKLM